MLSLHYDFDDAIPQTPKKEFEEAYPQPCDPDVGCVCPLAPNKGKPLTERFVILLPAYNKTRI